MSATPADPTSEELKARLKERLGETEQLTPYLGVWFRDVKEVFPALDVNPDETLLVTVPLPGWREHPEGRHRNSTTSLGIVLVVVTDQRELFECSEVELLSRRWLSRVPAPILRQRWSAASLQAFVRGQAPLVAPWSVYQRVLDRFQWYIDFSGLHAAHGAVLCATYVLATYFFFLNEYFPYLKFGGVKGSGKSKAGTIFAALGFNGEMSGSLTAATIYRFAQDTRGTMVIDEAEHLARKSDERMAYFQVLNSGFRQGGRVLRTDKDTMRPTVFSAFSPKAICAISGLEEVLEDRTWELILVKSTDAMITNREVREDSPEWQPLRDELYLLMMQHWRAVKAHYEGLTNAWQFPGRIWNLAKPLLALARFLDEHRGEAPPITPVLVDYIQGEVRRKQALALESRAAIVLRALYGVVQRRAASKPLRVAVKDVVTEAVQNEGVGSEQWITSRFVTTQLRNLQLYREPKRSAKHGGYAFETQREWAEEAATRLGFVLTEPAEETEATEAKPEQAATDATAAAGEGQSVFGSDASVSSVSSVAAQPCAHCGQPTQTTYRGPLGVNIYLCSDPCARRYWPR